MPTVPFNHVVPILCVTDMPASLEHYATKLGFEIAWKWSEEKMFEGGAPTFACVRRGDISLFLCENCQGQPGSWMSLFVDTLEDLESVYQEYRSRDVDIAQPPTDESWGMREMLVRDPDGNVFRIGAALGEDS